MAGETRSTVAGRRGHARLIVEPGRGLGHRGVRAPDPPPEIEIPLKFRFFCRNATWLEGPPAREVMWPWRSANPVHLKQAALTRSLSSASSAAAPRQARGGGGLASSHLEHPLLATMASSESAPAIAKDSDNEERRKLRADSKRGLRRSCS